MYNASNHDDKNSLINSAIDDFFKESIDKAATIDTSYRRIWEELYVLIRSGGKRLRPQLTITAYQAFGGTDVNKILPVALSQELLHFSLLIHDDIIDRDFVRYGTQNISGRYRITYSKFLDDTVDEIHYANSAAILAGDLMLSSAHQVISSSDLSAYEKSYTQDLLSKSIFEVAGGELLDTESSFVPYKSGDALKIARYKTAGYSFSTPLLSGAKLAGAQESDLRLLDEYAVKLGGAYQLVDDLLGVFGDEKTTGKSNTSDIVEGKKTLMVEKALHVMSPADKKTFQVIFGNKSATPEDIATCKQLLITTGAKIRVEELIHEYASAADALLSKLSVSDRHKEPLKKLVQQVTERAF